MQKNIYKIRKEENHEKVVNKIENTTKSEKNC